MIHVRHAIACHRPSTGKRMICGQAIRAVLLLGAFAAFARAADRVYLDPAPPALAPLAPDTKPLQPIAQPELTFHQAPRQIPSGAVTEDWPSFLGPHHNAISSETKLLAQLPPAGPPIVWEVKKGTGYSAVAVVKDRLILLHRVGDNEVVECLQAETGQGYWSVTYPTAYQDRYGY